MRLLIDTVPEDGDCLDENAGKLESKSDVAPFRIVNIGNSQPSQLLDFIIAIEKSVGIEAVKNFMPMQAGDVPATWADTSLLEKLTGYKPNTDLVIGVRNFVTWYRTFYNV
jgi:UDP-glucuronate 4-epimerase